MKSRQVVLGILMSGPKTGYDITMIFQTRFAFFFGSSTGMVYPTLRKLNQEGEVSREIIPQTGKPNKKVYTITETGKAEFAEYLDSPVDETTIKSDFLARMYFGSFTNEAVIVKQVENELKATQERLNRLETYNNESYNHHEMTAGAELSFKYGIAQFQAEIKVLQDFLNQHS